MNKVQKLDCLIEVLPNISPLRDEINRLFHAREGEPLFRFRARDSLPVLRV